MTETEDERGDAVDTVTKVARMSGGSVRRQPPDGEHDRRRPWGVAPRLRAEAERDEDLQRRRECLRMMDLSDHEWKMRQEWGDAVGKPAPPRHRGWSNLQKGRLQERVKDFEADLERNRAGLAARERARFHHELRWEKRTTTGKRRTTRSAGIAEGTTLSTSVSINARCTRCGPHRPLSYAVCLA